MATFRFNMGEIVKSSDPKDKRLMRIAGRGQFEFELGLDKSYTDNLYAVTFYKGKEIGRKFVSEGDLEKTKNAVKPK